MKNVLFIAEGEKDEPLFITKMCREFRGDSVTVYSYRTNIHILIAGLFGKDGLDEDIDLMSHLISREKDNVQKEILRKRFTDVFLVFDMDPQDTRIETDKIERMLSFFSDSADNGKLYLNYPMLESYKHLRTLNDPEFGERKVPLSEIRVYKQTAGKECHRHLRDVNKYTKMTFKALALMHLKKANRLIGNGFVLPSKEEFLSRNGTEILREQDREMKETASIYVLNTSLFNIIDYNPSEFLK